MLSLLVRQRTPTISLRPLVQVQLPPIRPCSTSTAPLVQPHKKPSYTSLVPSNFFQRMTLTVEISVSKLFPGGFGWQAGSVVAGQYGFAATEIPFWVATGVGDLLGVFLGHMIYMRIKKWIFPSKKTMFDEFGVATWLGSAAFCSGTLWQPAVNFFVGYGFAYPMVAILTTCACATAFFTGLRLGRRLYCGLGIEKAHPRNFAEDAGLSVAIGGASGLFVGTDITIAKNPFDTFVGIYPNMTALQGCTKAGISTAVGFGVFHSIQNTRAQASSAYVTQETFKDIASTLIHELERSETGLDSAKLNHFVQTDVNNLFLKLDKDGDGKLSPDQIKDVLVERKA